MLLGPDGLTERTAVFDRRDVLRAWCGQLPGGAPVQDVERLTDRLLGDPQVVPLDLPADVAVRAGAARSFARHTTTDLLALERGVLATALASQHTGRAVVDNVADHMPSGG